MVDGRGVHQAPSMPMSNETPKLPLTDEDARLLARRKLLKAGFMGPAVLASLVLASDAAAQCRSCNPPAECQPERCQPRGNCF